VQAVCNEFDVHRTELVARRRRGNDGRLAAISLCRRLTDESVGTIGDYFGDSEAHDDRIRSNFCKF
jgi:chromosomal replication initiation ATPase DnaA